MADIKKVIKHVKSWEGGWSNHPLDNGKCTLSGITIGTYQRYYGHDKTCSDLKKMRVREWEYIFRSGYWDRMQGDRIENTSLAMLCMDMCWMSGTATAIRKIQKCLGVDADAIVGPITLKALNADPEGNFNKLKEMRRKWFEDIVRKNPSQKVFLRGWLNRLNAVEYQE